MTDLQTLLQEKLGDKVQEFQPGKDMLRVVVERDNLDAVMCILRDDPNLGFNYLTLLSTVDYQEHLEVVYHLRNMTNRQQVCVRVKLPPDDARVPSVTKYWATANWHEREGHELMGIQFEGHPDLRHLLLPHWWEGYPLRKAYGKDVEEWGHPITQDVILAREKPERPERPAAAKPAAARPAVERPARPAPKAEGDGETPTA
jgi:NADH/F420H2 dehydrogenase subunit C